MAINENFSPIPLICTLNATILNKKEFLKTSPVFQENLHCVQKWPRIKCGKILKFYPLGEWESMGYSIFYPYWGDGRKFPGLVKSMNFQRSTAKSPRIQGGWQQFATKFIEIEIFILTDFSRQSCRCKQELQGKKGKEILPHLIFVLFSVQCKFSWKTG